MSKNNKANITSNKSIGQKTIQPLNLHPFVIIDQNSAFSVQLTQIIKSITLRQKFAFFS